MSDDVDSDILFICLSLAEDRTLCLQANNY